MNQKKKANELLTHYLTALAGGGAVGAGVGAAAGSMLFEADQANKPEYARRLTSQQHATNDAATWDRETPMDYLTIQGIRQALMGGRLSGDQLDELLLAQALSPRVEFLTTDIHDFGKTPGVFDDPRYPAMQERYRIEKEKNDKALGLA